MRRLDGGTNELASILSRTLQAAFPGVEFFLDSLGPNEYGVMWNWSADGAPGQDAVAAFISRRWHSLTCRYADAANTPLAGKFGGRVGAKHFEDYGSIGQRGGNGVPGKQIKTKTCKACKAELPVAAKFCTACGVACPACWWCKAVLLPGMKFCAKCGVLNVEKAKHTEGKTA